MKLARIIMGLTCMFLLGACTDSPMFFQYKPVNAMGWQSCDSVVFKLPEVEEDTPCDVSVCIRSLRSYRYQDLALVVKLKEGRTVVCTDTVKYRMLSDDGESMGEGLSFMEYDMPIKHRYTLKPDKKYKVKITHIMRLDPLDGVSEVGLSIASSHFAQHPFSGR